jgi:hypothetical protein
MTVLPDAEGGDPRYVSSGVTGGGEVGNPPQDTRMLVESIYEQLKTILARLDENMPWITRATQKDGGK